MKRGLSVRHCLWPLSVLLIALGVCGCKSSFLAPRTGEYFQTTRMGPGNSFCAYGLPLFVGAGCLMSGGPAVVLGIPLVAVGIPVAGVGFVADVCVVSPMVDLVCLPYDLCQSNHGFYIRIVDENGRPLPGVTVKGTVNHGFHMDADISGTTDEFGELYVNRLSFEDFRINFWSAERAGKRNSGFQKQEDLKADQDGRYVFQFTLAKANPGGWNAKANGSREDLLAFLSGKWSADAESRKWLQHGFDCSSANDLSRHWIALRSSGAVDYCAPEWYSHWSGKRDIEVKSYSWKLEKNIESDLRGSAEPEAWTWRVRINCTEDGKDPVESDYFIGEDESGIYLSPGPFKSSKEDYGGKVVLKFRKVKE